MTSLSSQERTVIQTLLELNYSVRAIAHFIKRSPSTVSIEIHQVTPYKAEIAHALALKKRHLRGRHDTLTPAIAGFFESPHWYIEVVTRNRCACFRVTFQNDL